MSVIYDGRKYRVNKKKGKLALDLKKKKITDINEMGQYTFDNLDGDKDFAKKAKPGDIIITAKTFGAGSSRQQAVDCFKSLGISAIIAESFGSIYERNAINNQLVSNNDWLGRVLYLDIVFRILGWRKLVPR